MSRKQEQIESATGDIVRLWVRKGQTRIEPSQDGMRLDRFLAGKFKYRSRTQWGVVIREGRITVNGHAVRPSRSLNEGDLIGYVPLEREEPEIDTNISILYCDPFMTVIGKSGNLPIHPSGRYFKNTLLHYLSREHADLGKLLVIHRLDRETSGVIAFGRTREATSKIATQFQSRQVRKTYLAIVDGQPEADDFLIDHSLGPSLDSIIRKAVGVRNDGISASTRIKVLHRGDGWALVQANPHTGRMHQIRVHLKSAGLPILGDKVYGQDENLFLKFISDDPFTAEEEALLGLPRQALHAYQLELTHPDSGNRLTFTAPLPDDMAGILTARGLDPTPWQSEDEI
jgi:23S rRNA pseudouridine1911/1915/1917 synthase